MIITLCTYMQPNITTADEACVTAIGLFDISNGSGMWPPAEFSHKTGTILKG